MQVTVEDGYIADILCKTVSASGNAARFRNDWFAEEQYATGTQCVGKESMRMKKLFGYAEKYIAGSNWKDLAMLKFCLFAMGILAGMRIPERNRKQAGWIAAAVFTATYIPLMAKFFSVIREGEE